MRVGGLGSERGAHPLCVGCRTGEKLSPDPAKASSESQRCLLCLCALDIDGGEWGAWGGVSGGHPCTPQSHACPPALAEEELALEPTLILEEPEENGCCQDTPAAG